MEKIQSIALVTHIVSGITSLSIGSLLMILNKGNKIHKQAVTRARA